MKLSRRKFIVAAPMVAGAMIQLKGTAFGQDGPQPGSSEFDGDMLSQLTWDSFWPYLYTDFTFGQGGNAVSLRLMAMEDSAPRVNYKRKKGQECFVLKFQGPFNQVLEQKTYQVNHFRLGDFKLFITNGGRVGREQYYIAVINRIAE